MAPLANGGDRSGHSRRLKRSPDPADRQHAWSVCTSIGRAVGRSAGGVPDHSEPMRCSHYCSRCDPQVSTVVNKFPQLSTEGLETKRHRNQPFTRKPILCFASRRPDDRWRRGQSPRNQFPNRGDSCALMAVVCLLGIVALVVGPLRSRVVGWNPSTSTIVRASANDGARHGLGQPSLKSFGGQAKVGPEPSSGNPGGGVRVGS